MAELTEERIRQIIHEEVFKGLQLLASELAKMRPVAIEEFVKIARETEAEDQRERSRKFLVLMRDTLLPMLSDMLSRLQ